MALPELPGTIHFLTDAAHLLHNTAPEISAHLMSQRGELLYRHGIPLPEVQRQHACGACGQIFVHGQGSKMKLESRKRGTTTPKSKRSTSQAPATSGEAIDSCKTLHCEKCQRTTRIPMGPPGSAVRRKTKAPVIAKKETRSEAPKQTINASSKKRSKNRKAGLQALLSGQKQQGTNPLSLSSFMK